MCHGFRSNPLLELTFTLVFGPPRDGLFCGRIVTQGFVDRTVGWATCVTSDHGAASWDD